MSEIRLFQIRELGAFVMSACGERVHVVLYVVLHVVSGAACGLPCVSVVFPAYRVGVHFTGYTLKETTDLDNKGERWIKHRYIPAPVKKLIRMSDGDSIVA